MKYRTRIYHTDEQKSQMWDLWQKGESLHNIARLFDRGHGAISGILSRTGGIRPPKRARSRKAHPPGIYMNVIDRHYPELLTYMSEQGRLLPRHVQKEFDEFLKCGRLEHGFLRVQCSTCHKERLVTFICKRRVFYSELPVLHPTGQQ